jgi:hypothetical protein
MPHDRHPDLVDLVDPEAFALFEHQMRQAEDQKYPLSAKLSSHEEDKQTVFDFLSWLRMTGLALVSSGVSDHDLWLEYLEIDPAKLEEERRAMLEEVYDHIEGRRG